MSLMNPTPWFRMATVALLIMGCTGCAYKVVRPLPLVVEASERSVAHTVTYPAYVVVHDSSSFWDAHQIKDNLFGLTQGEIVHWVDHAFDLASPGPRRRPWAHGIEWVKNTYAQLPDRAPVRIVGGLFSALSIEKTTVLTAPKIVAAPTDPMTYMAFLRVVYLTDWVQETLGEGNSAAGYLVPWSGPLIPRAVTAPVNLVMDKTQSGAITTYVYVVHKLNVGVDTAIDGCETAWGRLVRVFVR